LDYIHGPLIGLKLQHYKTKILSGKCESAEAAIVRFKTYQSKLNLTDEQATKCLLFHPDKNTSVDVFDSKSTVYGARILGSPIGSSQYFHE
jgi:hypothetical protein